MKNYKRMCKLLLEGDSYFKDEIVDMEKINKKTKAKIYYSRDGYKTNEECINALAAYIYMEFKKLIPRVTQHNHYDEYLLMWISDKLLKIHKKGKGKKIGKGYMDAFTLKQAYEQYLDKHKKGLDYWDLLNMQQGLKEANLWYMSEFYKLFNNICITIAYYNYKDVKSKQLSKYSKNCLNQYRILYMNIPKCKSYLYLLNKLKGIYDTFKSSAIDKNNLKTKLIKLTLENGNEMEPVRSFKTYDFSDSKCKFQKKKPPPSKPSKPNPGPAPPEISQKESLQTQPGPQDISESKNPHKEGSNHPNGQDGSKIDSKVSGSENGNPNGGANEPGAPSGGTDEPPSGSPAPSQDGKSDITNPLNQAGTSSTSGESIDLWSPFFKLILNGKEYYNRGSDFIDQNQQRLNDAKNKISGAYKDAMDNLKTIYSASNDYFNSIIGHITTELNQVNTPKSGTSGDKLPQNNDQLQKSGDPPKHTPKDTPQNLLNNLPSTPPSLSDSPSDSPKDPPPNPAPSPTAQKQPSPQSQHIIHQTPQDDPSNHKKTDNAIVHLVKSKSPDPNLKKPCNIFPTTWNGSEDCIPEIKFMNTILVCCTSEQCSLTGIPVILVLMPIILLIVYKYLSSGWRNELKGKKNMKKVINLFGVNKTAKTVINSTDRKKQMQIIIKSSSRKKLTKKSINSVYWGKPPLLNIYKIMQADPVPFINLFFLLIFFVYKRKRDTIEL
ncbi:PIR protein CIR protein [Plasmodium vinckei vinckei]|uniref:PIR protein CIR protein n=1 Tax=Plasmodium vinckei vinckei TaxID=54757 RepID=A0A449BX74_PLAVN|nr:PIR protein CIR protein [Plasmodium vinckei vinckei]VEV58075.1 PIR protein CIR protein [Plasmodium vinckei vinckei]